MRHDFPSWQHEPENQFSGLRVLPKSASNPSHCSREVQLITGNHYLALYVGKLTGYRATAEKVILEIEKSLGPKSPVAKTSTIKPEHPDKA